MAVILWDHDEDINGNGPDGNEIPVGRFIAGDWYLFWPSGGYTSTLLADAIDLAVSEYVFQFLPSTDGYYAVSTANPRTGTYHFRAAPDWDANRAGAGPAFRLADELVDANFNAGLTGFDIMAGDYTFDLWAMQSGSSEPTGEMMNMVAYIFNSSTGVTNTLASQQVQYPTSYGQLTLEFTITDQHASDYTHLVVSFDWDDERLTEPSGESRLFDVDDVVLTRASEPEPDTLYVKNTGFRFPYSRWT